MNRYPEQIGYHVWLILHQAKSSFITKINPITASEKVSLVQFVFCKQTGTSRLYIWFRQSAHILNAIFRLNISYWMICYGEGEGAGNHTSSCEMAKGVGSLKLGISTAMRCVSPIRQFLRLNILSAVCQNWSKIKGFGTAHRFLWKTVKFLVRHFLPHSFHPPPKN